MAGKKVRLIIDPTQDTFDKYNRLLAHVFLEDGSYYQELAIKNGYGFRYVYKKPTVYDGRLLEAELLAKSNNVGVWDKCGGKRAAVQ
jgi:micrococcal nuclease